MIDAKVTEMTFDAGYVEYLDLSPGPAAGQELTYMGKVYIVRDVQPLYGHHYRVWLTFLRDAPQNFIQPDM